MARYKNKRRMFRGRGGRFRKATAADFGIGGVCDCGHFLLMWYDGDPRDGMPDPRKIRHRCFTCEPKTESELALEAEIKAEKEASASGGLVGMLEQAAKDVEERGE